MGGLLSNSAAVADIEARHLERQKRRAEVSRRAIQSLLDKAAGFVYIITLHVPIYQHI